MEPQRWLCSRFPRCPPLGPQDDFLQAPSTVSRGRSARGNDGLEADGLPTRPPDDQNARIEVRPVGSARCVYTLVRDRANQPDLSFRRPGEVDVFQSLQGARAGRVQKASGSPRNRIAPDNRSNGERKDPAVCCKDLISVCGGEDDLARGE